MPNKYGEEAKIDHRKITTINFILILNNKKEFIQEKSLIKNNNKGNSINNRNSKNHNMQ